jgi:Sigma-70 factor, region 1.1
MQRLECSVIIEIPDLPHGQVRAPQISALWLSTSEARVTVHFMENGAYEIVDPHAITIGTDISLRYSRFSRSGVTVRSQTLRRVIYHFTNLPYSNSRFSLLAMPRLQTLERKPQFPDKEKLKKLIQVGKDRGYLTLAEIADQLPGALDAEQIESIASTFRDLGIEVS